MTAIKNRRDNEFEGGINGRKMYEGIYSELPSEEEVEIMSDENCREYSENDYVSLKNGGEGRIVKIIYVVMDNEEEVLFLKKLDIGNITTKDL